MAAPLPLVVETLNSVPRYSGGVGMYAERLLGGYVKELARDGRPFGLLDTWQGDRNWCRNFPAYRYFYGAVLPPEAEDYIFHAVSAFRCVYRNSGEFMPRGRRCRVVATHHDFIDKTHPYLFSQEELRLRRDAYGSFPDYAGFVVPSRPAADRLVGEYGIPARNISVIHHGNDQHAEVAPDRSDMPEWPYVLAVGKIYPHKNWGRLIAALAGAQEQFRERGLRLLFLTADFERYEGKLLQLREKHGLEGVLEFRGFATNEQLSALFADAAGFVFPSLVEGFGMPLFEAQALGLPVCVSDIPVFRELVALGDYPATLFDPYSVGDMSAALSGFVRGLGENRPRPFVRTWRQVAREHLDFFDVVTRA